MEDTLSVSSETWKRSNRRGRKTGWSNIFTGVNLHQLHRLFRRAGDRHSEHRARLVWRDMDRDTEGSEEEEKERQDEALLVQALVGLRVRSRNKTGMRTHGNRDRKWLRAPGYLRTVESPSNSADEEQETDTPSRLEEESLLEPGQDVSENPKPFKPNAQRLDPSREECARPSERYLHRILH
ncbi:arginine vasopressin-induced protein 1 [Notolabrus celidotus]|uniref:arginine vasopressin-induced protein 1 n=1 Tax=Notolabrus celidotus TaxID=1203425 RepID=UPI00148FBE8B|nr:arginine vasopressin-induced protein 1 [Notolabrus celidotus]